MKAGRQHKLFPCPALADIEICKHKQYCVLQTHFTFLCHMEYVDRMRKA